jgi:hypothetical protein
MAAMNGGDAAGFAKAMGIEEPRPDYLAVAAATPGPFYRPAAGRPSDCGAGPSPAARPGGGVPHEKRMSQAGGFRK